MTFPKSDSKSLLVITAFLLALVISSVGFADTFKGLMQKNPDGSYVLIDKNNQSYTLNFSNTVSRQQICRLATGDFASVTAELTNAQTIVVSSVDYIGLSMLTGVWQNSTGACYQFAGFTALYVYSPDSQGNCSEKAPSTNDRSASKYTYFINPDIDSWNLLISSATGEYVGALQIVNSKRIEIQLFDSQTNDILGTLVLRR